ncbi:putative PAS/PAC sensor protein [Paludibacter propionicigenes WB4]|uniref:histidine kinase n=1 Tax=Paludibacter propionicigenes (strain DSM 17365 / JCM 13257 / WB4) TaxID=694427 RepID=E4T6G0_PALPW|nr:PAS domain S-box protein [Paludibacter propionicigenes]ADQ80304.1 putative PAS/PAC sensor protein [Paludibacter propionicigenes WB4]
MEALKETILIIEDDAGLVELLNERIQEQGFQTANVNSAREAFDWIKNQTPSLILLDYSLPDKNGKEFIADLMSEYQMIPPFILATGQGDERIAVEMMKLGARDYIVKDANFLDLIPIVITRVCKEVQNELKIRQIELALIESNQFNKQIVASAQEGIVVYDKDLKFQTWNPFMEELTGIPASDVIGEHVSKFSPLLEDVGILENIMKALRGIVGPEIEFFHYYPASGKAVWLSDSISVLRNTDDEIIGVISTIHDITERKKAEEEIIKLSKHYQAIIENAPDGFVLLNSEGQFKYFSPSALKMFGYSLTDELVAIPDELTHPDDLPFVLSTLDELFKNPGLTPTIVYRFKHKNGTWIWIESTFSNLLNDPAVEALVINFRDVTERKNAEVALRESENKFRSITEQTTDLIAITDVDGVVQYVSPSSKSIFGFETEEMVGHNFVEFLDDSSIEKAMSSFKDTVNLNIRVVDLELTMRRKDGSLFIGELNGTAFEQGSQKGSLVIIRDITERTISREDFIDLFDNAPIGYHEVDTEGRIVRVNRTELNMLGYTAEEQIGLYVWKNAVDEQRSIKSTLDKLNGRSNSVTPFERDIRRKDGSTITVSIQDKVLRDDLGNITGIRSTIQDITERKQAEEAIIQAKQSYFDIFNSVSEAIYVIDETGCFIEVNKGAERMYQRSREELIGLTPESVSAPGLNNIENVQKIIQRSFETGTPANLDFWGVRKNGEVFLKEVFVNKGKYFDKEVLLATARDVTDRKLMENDLRESEEKYRYLFDNNPQPMYICDMETLYFLEVNQSLIDSYGYSREEFLRMKITDIRPPEDIPELLIDVRADEKKHKLAGEWRHIKKDGSIINVDITTVSIISNGRKARHVLVQDITLRKKAEEELKNSFSLLNATLESTADGIMVVDLKGTPIIFNKKFIEMWNVPTSVIAAKSGRQFLEYIADQIVESDEFASNVKYLYNNHLATSVDTVFLKDGRIFERYSIPQRIESSIVGRVWSFRDITENKRAEEALRVSEEKFRSITEQISDYISICDLTGVIQYASPASKTIFQFEPDEMQGHHFLEFIVEESLPMAYEVFNKGIDQKLKAIDVELELKRKDGSTFFAELNGTSVVFGNENRILVIIHDITHRKKVENALRESEDKYRTMIEYSNDLIWALDSKGNFTFLNRMAINTAEINSDEWIGKSFDSFVLSEDLAMLTDVFQRTMAGENCTYELRFKKSETTLLTISVNTSPIYNNGKIEGVVSFGRDITERKKAEEALRASEELYRNLVLRIPDGVYKSTSAGKFVDVNPAMIQMLGYDSKEELMAIDIKTQLYFNQADRESLTLDEFHKETSVFQLKKKDGTAIWIEDHGWYNVDESGNVLFHEGVLRDITERKISELALQEKMDELLRFHNLTIDREMMMIELKREVNRMLVNSGQQPKYKIVE